MRQGEPIESCVFDGDDLETTCHLGLYFHNKLIGVSSFFKTQHPAINSLFQYQLRGMAILKEHQGLGIGNLILKYGENILKQKNTQTIWCNARENAATFYKKNNYLVSGDLFDIPNIGLHYLMFKTL